MSLALDLALELTVEEEETLDDAAALSPVEYGRVRAELAEKLGVRVTDLDAEMAARKSTRKGARPDKGQQGTPLLLEDPEQWLGEVDGAELLDALNSTFRRYLALTDGAAEALALWTIHAHAHASFMISPVLALTSPTPRCGKTTTLELLGALVPRPLHAANLTPAVVFRVVEAVRPTLLVDEADSFLGRNDELRGILNSGHRRGSATVARVVGDENEVRMFSTWAPKAIAAVGKLPGTLADRSVEVVMRRRLPDEEVDRLRLDRLDALEPLRRQAWRWANDHADALRVADPTVPGELHDRAADNARPLLAIASLAGGEWPKRARVALLALAGAADPGTEAVGVALLAAVGRAFETAGTEKIFTSTLLDTLHNDDEAPEGPRGRELSPRDLAHLLRPFDVRSKTVRIGDETAKGYDLKDLRDPFHRYLPRAETSQTSQPHEDAENSRFEKRHMGNRGMDTETAGSLHPDGNVTDVTDSKLVLPLEGEI